MIASKHKTKRKSTPVSISGVNTVLFLHPSDLGIKINEDLSGAIVHYFSKEKTWANLVVSSKSGKTHMMKDIRLKSGHNDFPLEFNALPSGEYKLNLFSGIDLNTIDFKI